MNLDGPMTVPKALLYLFVALALFFLMLPNFMVFPFSISPTSLMEFPPRGFSWQWYEKYFTQPGWLRATWISFYVAILTTIISVTLGSLAAYGLVRGTFVGKRAINALILLPIIIPTLLTAVAIFKLYSNLRLTGTMFGFVIGHSVLAIPFVITIMTATLRGIDPAIENAARNLGAGRLKTVWRITFPLAKQGMMSAALFAFLVSFDELLIAVFISSPTVYTLPKKLWEGIRMEIDPSLAAVSSLLVIVSVVILALAGYAKLRMDKSEE
jgi:ABC-type spermidine/putrescine transport system permease subunit II